MRMRHRFKRACVNFIRELAGNPPYPNPKEVIRYVTKAPDPTLVFDNQLLAGKNVLITGAGQNIGRATAHEMAQQGANIYFLDLNPDHCACLEQALAAYPVTSQGFCLDITNQPAVDILLETLTARKITIDILVNNVGIQYTTAKGLQNLNLAEWRATFETNVFGPMYLTQLIAQTMSSRQIGGNIIFITSIHQRVIFQYPSYSASKAALGMIIKELAVDLAPQHIRVNGIAPGWVIEDTEGQPLAFKSAPLYQTTINPAYIGRAAVYLAADYFSRFTTGAVITIDGGLSIPRL
ncbi:MAG: SDR family oxidoreductase [Anaerolineales bacterium]|nr:SDR family oxidoreductase [Anaerolineales bacterium]